MKTQGLKFGVRSANDRVNLVLRFLRLFAAIHS